MTLPNIAALIVEDDPDLANLLAGELGAHPAFSPIEVTTDGEAALTLFAKGFVPGLVLLDLDLPKVHGKEILRRLHEDPRFALTAVVVTGSEGVRDEGEKALLGEIWYPKPFGLEELNAVIRMAIASCEAERTRVALRRPAELAAP
jgi:DNA-binding response OmpR family regulator